jgi:hypothetical protein
MTSEFSEPYLCLYQGSNRAAMVVLTYLYDVVVALHELMLIPLKSVDCFSHHW